MTMQRTSNGFFGACCALLVLADTLVSVIFSIIFAIRQRD